MARAPERLLNLSTAGRVWLVVGIAVACLIAVSVNSLRVLESSAMEERRAKLRATVDAVHALIATYGAQVEAGKKGREEAQREVMERVRALRYQEKEYFWINDLHPRVLMHPIKPELEGRDVSNDTDAAGKRHWVDFVRVVQSEPTHAGFVAYLWSKPGMTKPVPKLSYVKLYAPWGWVVGSGVYLDDVHAAIWHEARLLLAVASLVVLVLGSAAYFIARGMRHAVTGLCREAAKLEAAVREGRLSERAAPESVGREFRSVVEGMNMTADAFVQPIRLTAEYVHRIAIGDVPPKITDEYRGDFGKTKDNLNSCIDAVNALIADAKMLSTAAVEGKLATRADASRHQGDFRKIIQGVNDALDAVVGPIHAAARYVDQISRGEIPSRMTSDFRGDFNVLRDSLNRCIDAVNALVADSKVLANAAVEGKLATRAEPSRHQGEFRSIVVGVNATLDAVLRPLQTAAHCVEKISHGEIPPPIVEGWKGDFGALRGSLNRCIEAVNRLAVDTNQLAVTAIEGKLEARADASPHEGEFRRAIDGVNRTLDALLSPVQEASQVLEELAKRDLTIRSTGQYQGDHARLQRAANATAEALHSALLQVAESAAQVSSAADRIASSSQSVASGASEQAASLEETSSSLESMSEMTKRSSDNAQHANALAQTAHRAATDGTRAMSQMQDAMTKIRSSAEGTSQIIKDINEIAFQTNLLALNAAVEAARAGEAGRGFAVVADEVRSLALRSKEAATKTEELIRQSVSKAEEGATVSRQVGDSLNAIAQSVEKVTHIVAEIAAAAKEQAAGIEHVTRAVSEMDKVTQQNAANSEESSSAGVELSSQAQELGSLVSTFRLERNSAREVRSPISPPSLTPTTQWKEFPGAPPSLPAATGGPRGVTPS